MIRVVTKINMNRLEKLLERDLSSIAALKNDMSNVEDLLEDEPVDPNNLLAAAERRERQMDELQTILPALTMFDTHRIAQRSRSLSNDQLFKALIDAFEQHNTDLNDFKQLSAEEIKGKKDLKKKSEELTRIALKQR